MSQTRDTSTSKFRGIPDPVRPSCSQQWGCYDLVTMQIKCYQQSLPTMQLLFMIAIKLINGYFLTVSISCKHILQSAANTWINGQATIDPQKMLPLWACYLGVPVDKPRSTALVCTTAHHFAIWRSHSLRQFILPCAHPGTKKEVVPVPAFTGLVDEKI